MNSVIVGNVRCFQTKQEVQLKQLNLLVGENSSGKSTFLAVCKLAWDLANPPIQLDFNAPPFDLGAFDDIATYRGGRGGRAHNFVIGCEVPAVYRQWVEPKDWVLGNSLRVEATFESYDAQPCISKLCLGSGDYDIHTAGAQGQAKNFVCEFYHLGTLLTKSETEMPSVPDPMRLYYAPHMLFSPDGTTPLSSLTSKQRTAYIQLLSSTGIRQFEGPMAIAPIRTRPQRTYDPRTSAPKPEGDHVPMVLAKAKWTQSGEWRKLAQALRDFGSSSGLFDNIEVRRLGSKMSNPFQIRLKLQGPWRNLIDVGYGVNQVLPILVECVRQPSSQVLLMQQPEVHLHPKAQAALGSFLAKAAAHAEQRLLVETHSDHLIDRVRMEVRDGNGPPPDQVQILFFERHKSDARIYRIGFDKQGNLINAPAHYREFFLQEENRLFGV